MVKRERRKVDGSIVVPISSSAYREMLLFRGWVCLERGCPKDATTFEDRDITCPACVAIAEKADAIRQWNATRGTL